jgi:hypothetical protein
MDAYPEEYFTTPLPLLVLSGLGGLDSYTELPPYPSLENGTLITSDLAPVTSPVGLQLLKHFLEFSGQERWVGTLKRGGRPPNSPSFKIVATGRVSQNILPIQCLLVITITFISNEIAFFVKRIMCFHLEKQMPLQCQLLRLHFDLNRPV